MINWLQFSKLCGNILLYNCGNLKSRKFASAEGFELISCLLGTSPKTPSLPATRLPANTSRSMSTTPSSSQRPSTKVSPLLALKKYKCTQAESPPQRLDNSGNSYELANTFKQAIRNLQPVVVVESSCLASIV